MACLTVKRLCNRHIIFNSASLILTLMGIISSIVTISYFAIKLNGLSEYDYLYHYVPANCRPVSGKAYNLTCDGETKWISMLFLENGLQAVENPFAIRDTRMGAIDDRNKIEMSSNYTCVCRFANIAKRKIEHDTAKRIDEYPIQRQCSLWTSCVLNSDFIGYMQRDNDRYHQTYVSFIVASVVSLIFSGISIPFSIMIIRQTLRNDYIQLE